MLNTYIVSFNRHFYCRVSLLQRTSQRYGYMVLRDYLVIIMEMVYFGQDVPERIFVAMCVLLFAVDFD